MPDPIVFSIGDRVSDVIESIGLLESIGFITPLQAAAMRAQVQVLLDAEPQQERNRNGLTRTGWSDGFSGKLYHFWTDTIPGVNSQKSFCNRHTKRYPFTALFPPEDQLCKGCLDRVMANRGAFKALPLETWIGF